MFKATSDKTGNYKGALCPYESLDLMPATQALNYGQAIFEGLKAQRTHKDRIVLFRPESNAARMEDGAVRMCMPPVPRELFVDAVKNVVRANRELVAFFGEDDKNSCCNSGPTNRKRIDVHSSSFVGIWTSFGTWTRSFLFFHYLLRTCRGLFQSKSPRFDES